MSKYDWLRQIPKEQVDLIYKLLYVGFRLECPSLTDQQKELIHQLFDEFYEINQRDRT